MLNLGFSDRQKLPPLQEQKVRMKLQVRPQVASEHWSTPASQETSRRGRPPRFPHGEASSWHQAGSEDLFRGAWLSQYGRSLRRILACSDPFQYAVLGAIYGYLRVALGS